jgi:hypothetical protein
MGEAGGSNADLVLEDRGVDGTALLSAGPTRIEDSPAALLDGPTPPGGPTPVMTSNGDAAPHRHPPAASPAPQSEANRLPGLLDLLGWVLTPTSLVTGVLYFAGHARTGGYWSYFGVDQALLEMSTTDYFLRAVDTLFPLTLLFAVGTLVAYQFHVGVRRRLFVADRIWCLQTLRTALLVVAALCLAITAANLFPRHLGGLDPAHLGRRSPQLSPILGIIGTSALGYALYLRGAPAVDADGRLRLPRPPALILFVLSFLMICWLFWEAEEWAYARGIEAAQTQGRTTWAVVYSTAPLNLAGTSVTPDDLETDGFRYRYSGFKYLRYSKGSHFLLVEQDHRVVVLRAPPELRVEFCTVLPTQDGAVDPKESERKCI